MAAFAGAAAWAASADEAPGVIRVGTYNLRLDLAADGRNAWPHRREAVRALIERHGFDLLGTQEGLPHQIDELATLPGWAWAGAGRDDGARAGEHAALFYRPARFELMAQGHFWLSATPEQPSIGWDGRCCRRLAQWVQLRERGSGATLFVFNAHFDHEGVQARLESARLLLRRVQAIAAGQPVIVPGDFNATPQTPPMRLLQQGLRDTHAASATPPQGPPGTFNGFDPARTAQDRIDHVFVSSAWQVLSHEVLVEPSDGRHPSDHHPVRVRLRLP
ncbi:MAG: endonuclease/exonuclease/phosphatase family protein [Rubrivivax sp.]|nr:endonuclease/exonuclease/phosphatase family protein [Rubrivivax sp.]